MTIITEAAGKSATSASERTEILVNLLSVKTERRVNYEDKNNWATIFFAGTESLSLVAS